MVIEVDQNIDEQILEANFVHPYILRKFRKLITKEVIENGCIIS